MTMLDADDSVQIVRLLDQTLNSIDGDAVRAATERLDRLSTTLPSFLISLIVYSPSLPLVGNSYKLGLLSAEPFGGENPSLRVSAATYLKSLTARSTGIGGTIPEVSNEYKDQLLQALLQAEPTVLKVLLELFCIVIESEFVKKNVWSELVPDLRSAIEKSNLISSSDSSWSTVNALSVLLTVLKPFQDFLRPKVSKKPVPQQLDSIAKEILVPLVSVFRSLVDKISTTNGSAELEMEKTLHIICEFLYFSVKSHMPSALSPLLGSFCRDMIRILDSLCFDWSVTPSDGYLERLKAGERSLLLFRTLIGRHRKHSDKLMPEIVNCSMKIVKYSSNISKLGFSTYRIISLAFDIISRVMDVGPGWGLLSPHFSFLLNEKDISESEEDADDTSSGTCRRKKGEKNRKNNQTCSSPSYENIDRVSEMVHDVFSDVASMDQPEFLCGDAEILSNILEVANQPLYDGCKEGHSRLSLAYGMLKLKMKYNLSEECMDSMSQLMKDYLPSGNITINSYCKTKKLTRSTYTTTHGGVDSDILNDPINSETDWSP